MATLPLVDGGYVETWNLMDITGRSEDNYLHWQKYDAGGTPVGPEYTSEYGPYRISVGPLSDAGYVILYETSNFSGPTVRVQVFDAAGQSEGGGSFTGWNSPLLATSPDGGFVVTASIFYGVYSTISDKVFFLFGNSGIAIGGGPVASQPTVTVLSNGDFHLSWMDGSATRTLTIDPQNPPDLSPPGAPDATAFDNVGTVTGQITTITNDTTPTIRVTVQEVGAIQLQGEPIPVTAEDVARGYKDVDLSLSAGDYAYSNFVRIEDANGLLSGRTGFSFTVDNVAPTQPNVLKVLDNAGSSIGEVPNGGTTDDTTPTLQISLDSSVRAGDAVQLMADGSALGGPVAVSSTDIAKGYVALTPAALADGTYSFSATVTDQAGNASALASSFVVTVQGGGAPSPPPTSGGYVETWNLMDVTGRSEDNYLHWQKYDAGGTPVGPEYTSEYGPYNVSIGSLSDGGYVLVYETFNFGGSTVKVQVFGAGGEAEGVSSAFGWGSPSLATSPDGGFIVTAFNGAYPNAGPSDYVFSLYDNSGVGMGGGPLTSQPTVSVLSNGDFHLSWIDGAGTRTLTIDPQNPPDLSPPAAPGATAFDNVGTITGEITTVTNDTTPTIRVTVQEIGTIRFGQGDLIQITAEDVARGYMDVDLSLSTPGEYTHSNFVRIEDANGLLSSRTTFSFTVDTVAPTQPSVLKVLDNAGSQTGEVPNGGTTDDNTPTLQVSLDSSVKEGDIAQLMANGSAFGLPRVVYSTDIAKGYISLTPASGALGGEWQITDGTYSFSATVTDQAGNASALASPFVVTVQAGGAPVPPPPGSGTAGTRGHDTLIGASGDDTLDGLKGNDSIDGGAGNDTLYGGLGHDVINGGVGNDTLDGGDGRNALTGGLGIDTFVWTSLSKRADTVTDFKQGGEMDMIDLTAIDTGVLSFAAGSTTVASAHTVNWYESGGNTIVAADVNGNGKADFQITLLGTGLNLTAADFIL